MSASRAKYGDSEVLNRVRGQKETPPGRPKQPFGSEFIMRFSTRTPRSAQRDSPGMMVRAGTFRKSVGCWSTDCYAPARGRLPFAHNHGWDGVAAFQWTNTPAPAPATAPHPPRSSPFSSHTLSPGPCRSCRARSISSRGWKSNNH